MYVQLLLLGQNVCEVNRERSCLAATSRVCDSTKHNGLVTLRWELNYINALVPKHVKFYWIHPTVKYKTWCNSCIMFAYKLKLWTLAKENLEIVYSGDLKSDHLKSGLFEGWISNGPVFKWLGFSNGYSYSPKHLITRPF